MHSLIVFLQADGASGQGLTSLIMIGLMFVVFYFFMIRPQMKRQKDEQKFREGLQKGDKVVTMGGVHGRILNIEGTTALLEIDDNVKVRIEKAALRPLGSPVGETKS